VRFGSGGVGFDAKILELTEAFLLSTGEMTKPIALGSCLEGEVWFVLESDENFQIVSFSM
jgi:hypothetical protein